MENDESENKSAGAETSADSVAESPKRKGLLPPALPVTVRSVPTSETPAARARRRIKEEMVRQHVTQADIAGMLQWSQSRVSKYLTGRMELTVDALAALCFTVNLSLVEAVRDQGMEFCAEMTPTELRVLERLRQLPDAERNSFITLFQLHATTRAQERRARPPKPPPKRP